MRGVYSIVSHPTNARHEIEYTWGADDRVEDRAHFALYASDCHTPVRERRTPAHTHAPDVSHRDRTTRAQHATLAPSAPHFARLVSARHSRVAPPVDSQSRRIHIHFATVPSVRCQPRSRDSRSEARWRPRASPRRVSRGRAVSPDAPSASPRPPQRAPRAVPRTRRALSARRPCAMPARARPVVSPPRRARA